MPQDVPEFRFGDDALRAPAVRLRALVRARPRAEPARGARRDRNVARGGEDPT